MLCYTFNLQKALLEDEENDDHLLDDHTIVDMNKISKNPNSKIDRLRNTVDDVVDTMKTNIEKVVDRGNNLNELNDRSEQLGVSADMFSKRSRGLRRHMYFRTCRSRLYLGATIGFILLFIICMYSFVYV